MFTFTLALLKDPAVRFSFSLYSAHTRARAWVSTIENRANEEARVPFSRGVSSYFYSLPRELQANFSHAGKRHEISRRNFIENQWPHYIGNARTFSGYSRQYAPCRFTLAIQHIYLAIYMGYLPHRNIYMYPPSVTLIYGQLSIPSRACRQVHRKSRNFK